MEQQTPFMMIDKQGNYKSFDFSPWGGIEGFLEMSKNSNQNGSAYKKLVPDLFRAVDMTATAIASLPFDICDDDENIIDSSVDWQNVVGGMDNPQRLLYLIASSLCGGEAYVLPTRTPRLIFNLQYLAPHTITPQIRREGLEYFDRVTDQGISERLSPDELLYFWLPDSDVEIGPALASPMSAAMSAAGLTMNMGTSMSRVSERGFIPPTLIGVDGMTLPGEKERVEKWWNSWLRGAFTQLAKVINAQKVTISQVGAGMAELKGSYVELKKDAKEDIAQAFGIPSALFMSDRAYATEYKYLVKQWYANSIFTTLYHTIEETFSDQLLKPWGYHMYFRPETIDAFQEDENDRGQALSVITNAIDRNPKVAKLVMGILGYDLTEEQEQALEELVTDKEQRAEEMQNRLDGDPNDPNMQDGYNNQQNGFGSNQQREQVVTRSIHLTPPMMTDLKTWCDMSRRFYGKGKEIPFDFECKALPEEIAAPIRKKLHEAKNEVDIIKAFEISDVITELADSGELKALVDAINEATKAPVVQPAPTYNITTPPIYLTAQMPEQGQVVVNVPEQPAPNVTVTNQVPEQPAPVVNVKNNVQTPTVNVAAPNVTNEVTVKPADVKLPRMPVEAQITTDGPIKTLRVTK